MKGVTSSWGVNPPDTGNRVMTSFEKKYRFRGWSKKPYREIRRQLNRFIMTEA